jgi:hypothetical protein
MCCLERSAGHSHDTEFDVAGLQVLTVMRESARFVLTVQSQAYVGGQACGAGALGHGRWRRVVAGHRFVRLAWLFD